ncbi:MAG: aminoglycoside phosphotransferase family protein [Nitrososphaerales archaeon]
MKAQRLPGASSSAVRRIHLSGGTGLVLRRYVWAGFLEDEPDAPQREFEALNFAAAHALPVPKVVAADFTGGDIGDGVPAILMTFLRGRALASPNPVRLAETAVSIHDTDPGTFAQDYFAWFEDLPDRPPSNARQPHLWERALTIRHGGTPSYRPTFIHRDFHPGNVLWLRQRCSGVVDWANSCRGPCGCDVATCYGNLIGWAGHQVADEFAAAYTALTGEGQHPYWEIASVLEHGPSPWASEDITESEQRLELAIAAMGTT